MIYNVVVAIELLGETGFKQVAFESHFYRPCSDDRNG